MLELTGPACASQDRYPKLIIGSLVVQPIRARYLPLFIQFRMPSITTLKAVIARAESLFVYIFKNDQAR